MSTCEHVRFALTAARQVTGGLLKNRTTVLEAQGILCTESKVYLGQTSRSTWSPLSQVSFGSQ